MRILDRQRYWAFLKAYLICFVALVGLYVVIDVFSNVDEFAEVASGVTLFQNIGRYYLIRLSLFYDRLCGVICMMAAVFTVTWMQKSNELIAMLAAGIGTKRVIRPVLISAVLVNGLAVVNQEWLLPQLAEELQKYPDDDGRPKSLAIHGCRDRRDIQFQGANGNRTTRSIGPFNANLPVSLIGTLGNIRAERAFYIAEDDPSSSLKGGWLLRGVTLTPAETPVQGDWLIDLKVGEVVGPPSPTVETFREGPAYFLRTNVTLDNLTRDKKQWLSTAPTMEIVQALLDPVNSPSERIEFAVFLHGRLIRPLLSLTLLCLSLPLVLAGDGRNMFINLGLALGTSAAFYAVCFTTQYLGGNAVISPELAAWTPLIGFGTLAAARWDRIRT